MRIYFSCFFEMEKPERKKMSMAILIWIFLMVAQAEVKMFISFNFCRISITRGEFLIILTISSRYFKFLKIWIVSFKYGIGKVLHFIWISIINSIHWFLLSSFEFFNDSWVTTNLSSKYWFTSYMYILSMLPT